MARIPQYQHHKATGRGRVTINGRDIYLPGPFNSDESKAEYRRLIDKWQLRQRTGQNASLTIGELVLLYDAHVAEYYVKDGKATSEVHIVKGAMKPLVANYSRTMAADFGPKALKSVRDRYVESGFSRATCNAYTRRVVAMFKWAVSEQLVPVETYQALTTVAGLRAGRTKAPERPPVQPVVQADINAVLKLVSRQVKAMIQLQLLTGCRPGEVCQIRPCDVNREGEVWRYVPASHKNAHHGKTRVIFFGPRARKILAPFLDDRAAEDYCFSPRESEAERLSALHEKRVTPIGYGNSPGTNRKLKAAREPGECYVTQSYGRAIARACEKAEIESWSPNQLRHARATDLRETYGIEMVAHVLGHAKPDMSLTYAKASEAKAAAIMAEVG